MAITPDTLKLVERMRQAVGHIVDETARSLTSAWVAAWDEILVEVVAAIGELLQVGDGRWPSRRQIERTARAVNALDLIGRTLTKLADTARDETLEAVASAARIGLEGQNALVASQLPHGSTREQMARHKRQLPDTIDAIVRRTAEQINATHWPLADEATEAMKRELVRGVVVGDNPRQSAARMLRNLEGEFNGGLARALNLARTETLDAHREAAQVGQEDHEDVLDGWVWMCETNKSRGRTCPSCWALHGKLFPLDTPGPIDHQSGRCSRAPKTKSWADLGFEGIDEPDDAIPDARAIFNDLPQDERIAIMGKRRLELLDSGAIDWDDLSQLRTTPEWRDSYGVRPVKDLERVAAGDEPHPDLPMPEPDRGLERPAGRPEPEQPDILPDEPPEPEPEPVTTWPEPEPEPDPRAVPEQAQPYHRTLDGIENLAALVESGPPAQQRPLGGGEVAEVELLTWEDGQQVVRKTVRETSSGTQEAASEQLASLVARTLGLPAPAVYRNADDAIYMEHVAGRTAQEIIGWGGDITPALQAVIDSDDGLMLGLLDLLIFNWDRNAGNWMIDHRGRLVPIDHGVAWQEMPDDPIEDMIGYMTSAFADRAGGETNPFTEADIAEVRERLERLRPHFDHVGRGDWLDYGMRVLDLLAARATGDRNIIFGIR